MYKNASKGRALRQRVRSWDLCAPFFHLHDRQERPTLPLDHAELCAQTMCENAGGNGAYQVLPGMIWDSAYPFQSEPGSDAILKGLDLVQQLDNGTLQTLP